MKLRDVNEKYAIFNHSSCGPTFGGSYVSFTLGGGHDMEVRGSNVKILSCITYQPWPFVRGSCTIKEIEVFQLSGSSPSARIATSNGKQSKRTIQVDKQDTRFTDDINEALNANQQCLIQAESEMLQLEETFKDEQTFIDKFATGDAKDVIVLNVSGDIMVTTRSTLQTAEDSVLAQQFDDSKWT